jgi:acetyltransferase-like isoleucine patch superfamily enzyme
MKRTFLQWFVRQTEKYVRALANAYGLKVNRSGVAFGQHPLIFKGGAHQVAHQTPASCYFNTRSGSITVGTNTVFGEDVKVLTGKHANINEVETQNVLLHHVPESGRDIVIGEGCYIGSGAIIIGPVIIGDFTVIGAGSVVTKSFPDRVFVGGNPAKLIRNF